MLDRIAIIQRNNDPKGIQEQACLWLAYAGEQAGFDVIGLHRDHFDSKWLEDANIIIIIDCTDLHRSQKNDLFSTIFDKKKPYVTIIIDENEFVNSWADNDLYERSAKNYFCSPQIYRTALKLGINGTLSFLAGMIDDSWENLASLNSDEQIRNARIQFWRDIDSLLVKVNDNG